MSKQAKEQFDKAKQGLPELLNYFLRIVEELQQSIFSQIIKDDIKHLLEPLKYEHEPDKDKLYFFSREETVYTSSLSAALEKLNLEELKKISAFTNKFTERTIPHVGEGNTRWLRLSRQTLKLNLALNKELAYRLLGVKYQ